MKDVMETLDIASWEGPFSKSVQKKAIESLENGKILYLPSLPFMLYPDEQIFFAADKVDPKRKNISYELKSHQVGGALWTGSERELLGCMLKRYATLSGSFLEKLIPHYTNQIQINKTSFRPAEIAGRKSSVRKDDTRLHIDAFPSNPTKGKRILRFFTNINPDGKPRVWRVGEPFADVAGKFMCKVPAQIPGFASLLKLLKITKDKRSGYDHYMLHMHNKMKEDEHYQQTVRKQEILFPPGSSWIVFTDQVSHAALAGQHVLEQTFSLPAEGLKRPAVAPLKVLENALKRRLV